MGRYWWRSRRVDRRSRHDYAVRPATPEGAVEVAPYRDRAVKLEAVAMTRASAVPRLELPMSVASDEPWSCGVPHCRHARRAPGHCRHRRWRRRVDTVLPGPARVRRSNLAALASRCARQNRHCRRRCGLFDMNHRPRPWRHRCHDRADHGGRNFSSPFAAHVGDDHIAMEWKAPPKRGDDRAERRCCHRGAQANRRR